MGETKKWDMEFITLYVYLVICLLTKCSHFTQISTDRGSIKYNRKSGGLPYQKINNPNPIHKNIELSTLLNLAIKIKNHKI